MRKMLALLIVFSFCVCGVALAQEVIETTQTTVVEETNVAPATQQKQRFDIGVGYWYTYGTMDYYVYAPPEDAATGIFYNRGDKISELNNTLNAGLVVLNAEAWIWWRFFIDGYVGWGDFDGEQKDSDWLTLLSSEKWSLSKSDADGDARVWNVNGYLRLLEEKEDKGYFDFALGYFHYRDDIKHLKNSTLLISNWQPVNIPIVGHDSQDEYTYDGIRLGARAKIQLIDRLAIKLAGGICPWAKLDSNKFWNLRDDFGPPPGMKLHDDLDATIWDLTVGLEVKVTKHIFIEAGYKYIDLDADTGNDTRTWSSGTQIVYTNAASAEGHRGGFYGMGRVKF